MNSLYWRIFLAFWVALALILIGTVTVAVNGELQRRFSQPWVKRAELYAQATQAFEAGGPVGLRKWLTALRPKELLANTFVVGGDGLELLGRSVPDYLRDPPGQFAIASSTTLLPTVRAATGPLVLVGAGGEAFHVIVGPLRAGPHLFGALEMPVVSTATLLIALIVSGGVCFFLARYLVAPIDQLRLATRQIAAGDLNVRVSPMLRGRRNDDLGLLASDLDTMAERVRNLLESKQQLLRDVSHELRSPLARLQLALSLAQRPDSDGVARHLARIGCEADRLEQLIARTLRLASLESSLRGLEKVPLDLGELLRIIKTDVDIEADAQGCSVGFECEAALTVRGDPELLRSALENVIRNAVRYSPAGARVQITANRLLQSIEVVVRDGGDGVPEKDLALIFEPFYRVDAARNRAVGGDGLGLAIAARAVALHGGTIVARNRSTGGLAVHLSLPAMEPAAHDEPAHTAVGDPEELIASPPRAAPSSGGAVA